MPRRSVYIDSYFSIPTDLAAEMRSWAEFVAGDGYEASLRSDTEQVKTSLEHDEGRPFVLVSGEGDGPLFHRVLGLAFIGEGNRTSALRLLRAYFTGDRFLEWLDCISEVPYLEAELQEIPSRFETLYVDVTSN